MKSILMLGQSNMAGRGDFGEVTPLRNNRCFMLRSGRWQPMAEPVNPDRGCFTAIHSGVSLAESFADAYARYYQEDVGLIPCADGGTRISQWQPGELLFDHAVMQLTLALRTSDLAGVIWHQGESDSRSEVDAAAYHDRFMAIYSALDQAFGISQVPFVIGALGSFAATYDNGSLKWYQDVNAALEQLSREIPLGGFVRSDGLQCKSDGIHFNSASCREFGRRYFEVYRQLRQNGAGQSAPV